MKKKIYAPKICASCGKPYTPTPTAYKKQKACSHACGIALIRHTPEQRIAAFWAKVDKNGPGGCWLWTGAIEGRGYGHVRWGEVDKRAHHLSLELAGRVTPASMYVMHTCDVRNCVNPDHLKLGTHAENMADAMTKRRHVHGSRSIHAKLNEDQVREIRTLYSGSGQGRPSNSVELAKKYGVRKGTIANAAAGRTWRYVK